MAPMKALSRSMLLIPEEPVLRLSGTDVCFLCLLPPSRQLGGVGKGLGLKLSSGRLVQSRIDADDEEADGRNNAGNAGGCLFECFAESHFVYSMLNIQ